MSLSELKIELWTWLVFFWQPREEIHPSALLKDLLRDFCRDYVAGKWAQDR